MQSSSALWPQQDAELWPPQPSTSSPPRRLPPGAAAPRERTTSSSSYLNGNASPSAPSIPKSTVISDDLYASIERHFAGMSTETAAGPAGRRTVSNPASGVHLAPTARQPLGRSSPAASSGGSSLTESSIIAMYDDLPSEPKLPEEREPLIPPMRASSTAASSDANSSSRPLPPSPSAHRITATSYAPSISANGVKRNTSSRPLPARPLPAPNRRPSGPSSIRPLPSVGESMAWQPEASPPLPSTSHRPYAPATPPALPEPARKYSLDQAAFRASTATPDSPGMADPFDESTGRVLRHQSGSPAILTTQPSWDDGLRGAYATPPISPSASGNGHVRRSSSIFSTDQLSPNASLTANLKTATLRRNLTLREEPIPPHLNQALLSNIAVFVKDRVPRAEHTRGAMPFPHSFTGQDIVSTIQRVLSDPYKSDRRVGLHIARSLHNQLFFFDMRDNTGPLQDNLDGVYTFLGDDDFLGEGGSSSRMYNLPSELDELPTGVTVEVTSCYSPFCVRISALGQVGGCYSPSCPNTATPTLQRQKSSASDLSQAPSASTTGSGIPWAATVPAELLDLIGKQEVARQNEIHELITGEAEYVHDIDILRTEFLEPLQEADPPVIASDELSTFFAETLLNAFEIREHASAFSDALQHRQREQGPVIQSIGDIVVAAATDWEQAYQQYASDYPFAESRVSREKTSNPAFDVFLNSFTRRPLTRKLAMQHYQTRITVRLQRYILLLSGILKKTPEDNLDRYDVQRAIELLNAQCRMADEGVAASQLRLECRRYETDMVERPGTHYVKEFDLLNADRTIVQKGRMLRKPESSSLSDWTELFVVLLDNYFVMTKPRAQGRGGETKYHLSRRPIPLELLSVYRWEDPPVSRSSGFHLKTTLSSGSTGDAGASNLDQRQLYPIELRYLGRTGGHFTLYAESARARTMWREKLQSAIEARERVLANQRVFDLVPIANQTFLHRSHAQDATVVRDGPRPPVGRPTCSVSFSTPEGHSLVAVGHEDGLWIGLRHDPSSFRLVLHLKFITQCTVLQDFALVLVLADKALYAYPLEALVPSAASAAFQREKEPQKISGAKDVLFFKAGKVGPRLLVIYVKKSGVNQTVFKALEPIAPSDRTNRTLLKRRPDWFRTYKDFFCPSETFSIFFLRSQLSIVCAKGFELLSLEAEPLKMTSFPDWPLIARNDSRAAELSKRCSESRALAMFRLDDTEFLFVYEDLAIYSDKHGDPIPGRYEDLIEWHGRPKAVAFVRPYVLAFDPTFIEIRHAHTGKLLQIVKGREVQCTFDGLGSGGRGTGESERRPHVAYVGAGTHYVVAELAPIEGRSSSL